MVGGARGNGQITGAGQENAFALAAGGGVDMVLTRSYFKTLRKTMMKQAI